MFIRSSVATKYRENSVATAWKTGIPTYVHFKWEGVEFRQMDGMGYMSHYLQDKSKQIENI